MRRQSGWVYFALLWMVLTLAGPAEAGEVEYVLSAGEEEIRYIPTLDLEVTQTLDGKIEIVRIGPYSPFRKYCLFRIGDIIETVDGQETTLFLLYALGNEQNPRIQFNRKGLFTDVVQISLRLSIYGKPAWLLE